jgi:hypothetical protein
MTSPAPKNFGFGTGTAMDPNNPPQVAPSNLTLAPEVYDPYNGSNDMLPPAPPQSPLDQIQGYYQQELGRAGDEGGLDYWTGQAKSGMSMEDIRNAINNSQEGQRYDINDLYKTELGREADTGGFDFWLNALQGGMSLDDIRNQGFRGSEEYKNRQPEPIFDPYNPPEVYDPYNPPKSYEPPKVRVDPYAGTPYEGTGGPGARDKGFGPSGDVVQPKYPFPDLGTPSTISPQQPFLDGRPPESGGPFNYGTLPQQIDYSGLIAPNVNVDTSIDAYRNAVLGMENNPRIANIPNYDDWVRKTVYDANQQANPRGRNPFAGSISGSPTQNPTFPNFPIYNPVNTTTEEDMFPKTPRQSGGFPSGLGLLSSLFRNKPR